MCTEFSQAFKRNTNVCVWFFKLGMVQAVIWFFASLSLLTITNLNIIQIHWDQNKWPDHLLIKILKVPCLIRNVLRNNIFCQYHWTIVFELHNISLILRVDDQVLSNPIVIGMSQWVIPVYFLQLHTNMSYRFPGFILI